MLPKSWLKSPDADPATSSAAPPPASDDALKPKSRPGIDRAVTAALSTPHDAILAELQGRTPRTAHSRVSPAAPAPPEGAPDAASRAQAQTSPLG